jgi:hypothetical protein
MIRIEAGHYRDSFCNTVYEVKRYRLPLGTKTEMGWEFTISKFGINKMGFGTKEDAARRARVAHPYTGERRCLSIS